MTIPEFMHKIAETYGKRDQAGGVMMIENSDGTRRPASYSREQYNAVRGYLKGVSEQGRNLLWAELLRSFSWRWGTLPGPAELDGAWVAVKRNREQDLEPLPRERQIEGYSEEMVDRETAADFMADVMDVVRGKLSPDELERKYRVERVNHE